MSRFTKALNCVLAQSDKEVIYDAGTWYTSTGLELDIKQMRNLLTQQHIHKGDRVAIALPNSYTFIVAYLAVLEYGAVAAPVNPNIPFPELKSFLLQSQVCAAFFTEKQWAHLERRILNTVEETFHLHTVFIHGPTKHGLPTRILRRTNEKWMEEEKGSSFLTPGQYSSFGEIEANELNEDTLAVLIYTSGTTGAPKAVGLSHRNLFAGANNVVESHRLTAEDVTYCFLPLFHINAQVIVLLSTLLSRGRIVLAPKFSVTQFWRIVRNFNITWVSAVPTILAMLLNSPKPDSRPDSVPERLKFIRSASAPLPVLHARRFESEFGIPIVEGYGMTEATGQICVNPVPPDESRLGSVGLPVNTEVRVVDENGRVLSTGEIGELVLRGDSVITSYQNKDPASDFQDGWFFTGDLGYTDEDGFVYLTGRKKETINCAGEKISPYEIEDVIREHPRVQQVAVFGVPDSVYGERVVAHIITDSNLADTGQIITEITAHCRHRISGYKCPSEIQVVDTIPTGSTGKILRTFLKQTAVAH